MSGFIASDGSALAGGKLPSGLGEALNLDAAGNLLVNNSGGGSLGDGAAASSLGEQALGVYNSGGPVLANGVPSGLAFDRLRSWLGKGSQSNAITATNVGDTQLSLSASPKTLLPGTPLVATLTGGSSGIPSGALGVVYQATFSSASAGASLALAPNGASNPDAYAALGNLAAPNATLSGCGLLAVDANGRISIQASGGTCNVTLYTYGYVM